MPRGVLPLPTSLKLLRHVLEPFRASRGNPRQDALSACAAQRLVTAAFAQTLPFGPASPVPDSGHTSTTLCRAMTASPIPDMHDWTLLAANYDWPLAQVTLSFRTAVGTTAVVASEVADLQIPQRRSWGRSVSVNGAQWLAETGEQTQTLRIEMQSGDVITVEAIAFEVQ